MITAKLGKKPYLQIPKSSYNELARAGKKTVRISIHDHEKKSIGGAKKTTRLKKQMEFAEKTLGIWAGDPNIEQAFKKLDERWQQWRDETLL